VAQRDSSNLSLSIIIVNWNGGESLQACLRSVLAAARLPAEVWLVDNASSDGSAQRAAAAFPSLKLIQNSRNVGFARAVNQALEGSAGEFLLLLNPDVQIGQEALSGLLTVMHQDGRIGIAGCASVDAGARCVPGYESSFPGRRGDVVHQTEGRGQDVAWVSGACLLARRQMVESIGRLDAGFFMYYEDVDWCRRARVGGWRVVTLPGVLVKHELGGSSAHVPRAESARRAVISRLRFYEKHYSRSRARRLALGMAASALRGILLRLLPAVVSKQARAAVSSECARLRAVLGPRAPV